MRWTEEKIRFLRAAYERSFANAALADWIVQELPRGSRLLDSGCGLGYLSLELARRGMEATALDIDCAVLGVLAENLASKGIGHVSILCEDAHAHRPSIPYDGAVFCFFGGIDDVMRMAKMQCRGDVFYISRNYDHHRFSAGKHSVRYSGYRDAREALDRMNIPYTWQEMSLDMGQPFRNTDETRRFFALYSKDDPQLLSDAFVESRLIRTEDAGYPLFMPHWRPVGMIRFSARDIPDEYIPHTRMRRSCR